MTQLLLLDDFSLYKKNLVFCEIPEILDTILKDTSKDIRIYLIVYENDLWEKFESLNENKFLALNLSILSNNESNHAYDINYTFGRKYKTNVQGRLLLSKHPTISNYWILISDGGRLFCEKAIGQILKSIRPRISKAIITTHQFEKILSSFQSSQQAFNIRIRQFGQRGKIKSKGATKDIETDRKWTDLKPGEVFQESRDIGHWITDLSIEYNSKSTGKTGQFKIDREATLILRGEALTTFNFFVQIIGDTIHEQYNYLNNRGKIPSNNYIPRPFCIKYDQDIINTKEQITKLISVIKSIPNTRLTSLHGNPYYHSVFIDYSDGSVSEILIFDQNTINILPQGKASVRSLQRLCSNIFYNFREGELKDINYG